MQEEAIEPPVKGTKNVMEACAEMGSSIGAVYLDLDRNPFAIVNEDCCSNLDCCIQTRNWYCYPKTLAERSAWELAMKLNLEPLMANPEVVLRPNLQSTMDADTAHIMKYLTGGCQDEINPRKQPFQFSNHKLKDLNLSFTPMVKTLADTFESLHKDGLLQCHLSGWDNMDGSS
eukprot:PITA_29168